MLLIFKLIISIVNLDSHYILKVDIGFKSSNRIDKPIGKSLLVTCIYIFIISYYNILS